MSRFYYAVLLMISFAALAHGQNCTGQPPVMNHVQVANTSNAIRTTTTTLTVDLASAWTSNTGYASLFRGPYGSFSDTIRGYGGAYRITSGNGTGTNGITGATTLVLQPTGYANGALTAATTSGSGAWISDLGVIEVEPWEYTFVWSTPGYPSTTNISYGNDNDTWGINGGSGYNFFSQDTVTGVVNHSITLGDANNVIGGLNTSTRNSYRIWSDCFETSTPGSPVGRDWIMHNPDMSDSGWSVRIEASMQFTTSAPKLTPGQLWFATSGGGQFRLGPYQGYATFPEGGFTIATYMNMRTVGTAGAVAPAGQSWVFKDFNDDAGLFKDFAVTGRRSAGTGANGSVNWTGYQQAISIDNSGGNLYVMIPSNVPTGGTGCTDHHGEITTFSGVTACAYPILIQVTYPCGSNVCGPVGTTSGNVPYTTKQWVIVFNPPAVTQGNVGPWINPSTQEPGVVPCELEKNKMVDTVVGSSDLVCQNRSYGSFAGINGNFFTFEGVMKQICRVNAVVTPAYDNTYTATWFYDGGYVCAQLGQMYPAVTPTWGGTAEAETNAQNILGNYTDSMVFKRLQNSILYTSYRLSGGGTRLDNPVCNANDSRCAHMRVPVGNADVSQLITALGRGEQFVSCMNTPYGTTRYYNNCGSLPSPANVGAGAHGGNLPASTDILYFAVYMGPNGGRGANAAGLTFSTDSACPFVGTADSTSPLCSITINSPPAKAGAVGYNVYARYASAPNVYYLQNTSGPVPFSQLSFTFGTDTHPLQTTGEAWMGPLGGVNGWSGPVISADGTSTPHTITVGWIPGSSGIPPNIADPGDIFIVKMLSGLPADAGSNSSTVVCNDCDFSSVVLRNTATPNAPGDVVYCGVTFPLTPRFTFAPQPGSPVASKTGTTQLNLYRPINCAEGTNFEIRRPSPPTSRIFYWTNGLYDQWTRFHNYLAADAALYQAYQLAPGFAASFTFRREQALALRTCQIGLHLQQELGADAIYPHAGLFCTDPINRRAQLMNVFQLISQQFDNGIGNGSSYAGFLNGLVGFSLLQWWQDPMMAEYHDPVILYYVKHLLDGIWTFYQAPGARTDKCREVYPRIWAYWPNDPLVGLGCNVIYTMGWPTNPEFVWNGAPRRSRDGEGTFGNIWPMMAFFYQYTGNAVIPGSNPPKTYGQWYIDTASYSFTYWVVDNPANGGANYKFLGEMGLWQKQAFQWMGGTNAPAGPLTITTSSLPSGTVGTPYSGFLSATGGTLPYVWSVTGLPAGLSQSGPSIIGTPSVTFSGNVSVSVTDSGSPPATAMGMLPLTIMSGVPPIISSLPEFAYPIP